MNDSADITGSKAWQHRLSLSGYRGKSKGYCRCGWQSKPIPPQDSVKVIVDQYHAHAPGLIERQPKSN